MLETKKTFNHFKLHTQYSICEGAIKIEDLKNFCPWIYDDNNEPIVYTCDQENRPPYRTFNGSCNFLAGSINYDRHQVQLF